MIHTSSIALLKYMVDSKMMTTVHRYFKTAHDQLAYVKGAVGKRYIDVVFAVGRCQSWIDILVDNGVTKFCVDMAHGNSKPCVDTIEYIGKKVPEAFIMAGNVATADGYVRLIEAGADAVRVGIASGAICSTAKNTAFGVPMVTSLLECVRGQEECGGLMIADGGIRSAADILKAKACGADFVICGKLLASTNLAEGPFYNKNRKLIDEEAIDAVKNMRTHFGDSYEYQLQISDTAPYYVEYAGMASHEMRMRNESHDTKNVSIEGVCGLIKYSGKTEDVIGKIEANLKAGLSYCGVKNWDTFFKNVEMMEMSTAGIIEKETHLDV